MDSQNTVSEFSKEVTLKWDVGVRGAGAVHAVLKKFDVDVRIGFGDYWADAREMMGFLLVRRWESAPTSLGLRT